MKQLLLAALFVVSIIACNEPDQNTATGNTVDSLGNNQSSEITVDTLAPGATADSSHQH
jgi:hypothetical protein